MDNHMAAICCLEKVVRSTPQFDFIHVDQHYDLGGLNSHHAGYIDGEISSLNPQNLEEHKTLEGTNYFLYDNYIHLFCNKYPHTINHAYFITHGKTQFDYDFSEYDELCLFHLMNCDLPNEYPLVLNLDIDYFFTRERNKKTIKPFTSEFIELFGRWLYNNRKKFATIIVALSPEYCGGWDEAIETTNLILSPFYIRIEI